MKQLVWIFLVLTLSAYSQAPGNGVTDIDGNNYNSVIIGTQEWMKENLNVSKYSDGTPIPQITDPIAWSNLTTGAWCYYNNDPSLGSTYGKMYNWYAVAGIWQAESSPPTPAEIASRKSLAPSDWNVSSVNDWLLIINYLGGNSLAGGKMKEAGLNHWSDPNTDATNSSGFTGLPGGYRGVSTTNLGQNLTGTGHWWCSDYLAPFAANFFQLTWTNGAVVSSTFDTRTGLSVRWVKNSIMGNETYINPLFNIYPNPAKDKLTIEFKNNSNTVECNYKIINALGQEVQYGVLNSQVNIIQLNKIKGQGVYFVKIYDQENSLIETKKIIIE
jgi:uncharacterized protein (TIGR02145 family)